MDTDKTDNLTCEIIYDNFTCENYRFSKQSLFIAYGYLCSLYNKQNNTCVLVNTRFISRVKHDISLVRCAHSGYITFNTRNKSGIPAHPCIILYVYYKHVLF